MIRDLIRVNGYDNPHEFWSFELIATCETMFYYTGPQTDYRESGATWLQVIRGSEPNEIEIRWRLPIYLPMSPETIEQNILWLFSLGDKTIEDVVYPP